MTTSPHSSWRRKRAKGRPFKLQRSQSSMNKLGCRWKSSSLLQESLSQHKGSAFMPLPGYERLSQSTRFFSEEPRQEKTMKRLRQEGWIRKVMGHVFHLHKVDKVDGGGRKEGEGKEKEKERKKKRSSWLPDPERRWPVQGW